MQNFDNVEDFALTREEGIMYMNACEGLDKQGNPLPHNFPHQPDFSRTAPSQAMGVAHQIDMLPCNTIYEFLKKLNSQIRETLLLNTGDRMIHPTFTVVQGNQTSTIDRVDGQNPKNVYHHNHIKTNNTDPIALFEIKMDADFTFRVEMNDAFASRYYIKMSKALFNMLGFVEGFSDDFERTDLPGRRFMGDRDIHHKGIMSFSLEQLQGLDPPYVFTDKQIQMSIPLTQQIAANDLVDRTRNFTVRTQTVIERQAITSFVAPTSAADTFNRIKSVVFSSSLVTSSEGASGNTYRRLLTDFTVPVQTTFNFDTETLSPSGVSENAASEYTFNAAPSEARWLIITDPSPLYELSLTAMAKCWNFETSEFELEHIPLPIAGTFTCKLVFISRSEMHEREAPDKMKG